jgi:hypothetical protein
MICNEEKTIDAHSLECRALKKIKYLDLYMRHHKYVWYIIASNGLEDPQFPRKTIFDWFLRPISTPENVP